MMVSKLLPMTEAGLQASDLKTLVPLMLLLVERFSSLMRDIGDSPADLVDINPLWTPVSILRRNRGDNSGYDLLPRIGRVNVFHLTNVSLLFSAFVLILSANSGLMKNVLGFVVAIIWIQLPVIEIDEYDDIREAGIPPVSLYWHILSTAAAVGFAVRSERFEPGKVFQNASTIWANEGLSFLSSDHAIGGAMIVLFCAIGVIGYLKLLEWELRGAAEQMSRRESARDTEERSAEAEDTEDNTDDSGEFYRPFYIRNAIDPTEADGG